MLLSCSFVKCAALADHIHRLCPKFAEYRKEFKTSKTWMDHWSITQSVFNDIRTATDFTVGEPQQ